MYVSYRLVFSVPAGLAVAIGIHGASDEVQEAVTVEGDNDAGIGRERFEVEEGGLFPVGGDLDAGEDFPPAEVGVKARGVYAGEGRERVGEVEDGLAGDGDIGLAAGGGGFADGGQREVARGAELEDFSGEGFLIGLVERAVLVHVGEEGDLG